MWSRFLAMTVALTLYAGDARVLSARQQRRPLAVSFAPSIIRPGDVALVEILGARDDVFTVSVLGRTLSFEYDDVTARWRALLAIDLETKPGTYRLSVVRPAGAAPTERSLRITSRPFRVRHLRVAPEFVDPPEAVIEQITRDAERLTEVYARRTPRQWSGAFVQPVEGPASSNFGTRSYYNGERRSPHAGVDFAAKTGTPVRAPNAGTIALTAPLYFTGNTVVIDHGASLFSIFAHLSEINVAEGDAVGPDTLVGLVGATGRVTAAHLHWSVRLDGARVDPLALMEITKTW
jgi:murein DD-endopeptidase MepM/ murein hydrolase activator NlpD